LLVAEVVPGRSTIETGFSSGFLHQCLTCQPHDILASTLLAQQLFCLSQIVIAWLGSEDPIANGNRIVKLPQQWGIPCIAASMATAVLDAQLVSGSRL
jgi:hypothetical protein